MEAKSDQSRRAGQKVADGSRSAVRKSQADGPPTKCFKELKMKKFEIIIKVEPAQVGLDGLEVDEKTIEAEVEELFKEYGTPSDFLVKEIKVREVGK